MISDKQNYNIQLFGIPIKSVNLKIDNSQLISYCYNLKKENQGLFVSNQGGWHSPILDLNNLILNSLKENIKYHLSSFVEDCGIKSSLNFKIQSMWFNINKYKDYNISHNHPKNLFSGVYYLKTPKNCGNLEFINPSSHINYDWSPEIIKNYNNINSVLYTLPIKKNLLYLFPSWAFHSVKPNLNKREDRISIAFNISI